MITWILLGICAAGWFKDSVIREIAITWIKRNGLRPTEDEIRTLANEIIRRRFGFKTV